MNKKLLLIVIIVVIGASAFFMFGLPKTLKGHELTIATNIEEAGTISGGGRYEFNEDLSVKAVTNKGYYFLGWYFGEDLLSTSEEYNCKMWDKSVTLEAKFIALPPDYSESAGGSAMYQEHSLTVKSDMPNLGKVNLNDQGAKQEYKITTTTGTNFKLLALTTSANRFLGWFDTDDNLITTNGVFNFAMPTFEYTLSAKWDCPTTDGVALINNTYICKTCGGSSCKLFSNGGFDIFEESNKKILRSYFGDQTQIKIPDGVNKIGNEAFKNYTNITSIEIPNSVTEIGSYAFSGCSSLASIELPNSVTEIGYKAFYGCSGLKEISIPFVGGTLNGTSNTHFGYIFGATSDNTNYSYVPSSLKKVTITGVSSIGDYAFYSCDSLTSVVIGDSVTSIGKGAFYNCRGLTEITLPFVGATLNGTSNTHFGYIFGANSYSDNDSYVPNSLTKVTITGTSIGEHAFDYCPNLTSVVIGDSVTSIASSAFSGCYNLVEVINNSPYITVVKGDSSNGEVGRYALSVSNRNSNYKSKLSNDSGFVVYTNGTEKILVWYAGDKTDLILPNYITKISQTAFAGCEMLTSVVIGNNVTSIGEGAFTYCPNLTSVVIGNRVTSIGDYAFADCYYLTSVVIGDSVTSIGDYAFSSCYSLRNIYYTGTKTQWNAISKGSYWNYDTGNYTITYNYQG